MPPTAIHDPLERALSYREDGLARKKVRLFGFHQDNRGTMGISSYHTHEVAYSCLGGVLANRYRQVDAVRVPENRLEGWRQINKNKCDNDALMPKFSPDMRLAVLTKTHFSHAVKLEEDGARTLFNKGQIPIKFKAAGTEAMKLHEDGVITCIYSEVLWDDRDALVALMQSDNDDADVQMREDELQFQGRIDQKIREANLTDPTKVLEAVKLCGLRTFTSEEAAAFIDFRMALSDKVGDSFSSASQACERGSY